MTSEVLQRVGEYANRVLHRDLDIQLTTLDVHDEFGGFNANGNVINTAGQTNLTPFSINWTDFNEPSVLVWSNVDFADNYYQDLGTRAALFGTASATPNGREVIGADVNVHLNGVAGFLLDDADFEADIFNPRLFQGAHTLLGPHSRVWRWYAGTTDLNIERFEVNVAGNEPIFRSSADVQTFVNEDIGGGGNLPWYVPNAFSTSYYGNPSLVVVDRAVWEGIGLGWWYSELAGGKGTRPTASGIRTDLIIDNTASGETRVTADQTVWNGSAVASIFNGNFESGHMRDGSLNLLNAYIRGKSTPGWSLHQVDSNDPHPIKVISYTSSGGGVGHAAELDRGTSGELVHNRFYVPLEAQFVQFDYNVRAIEYALDGNGLPTIPRQPHVNVFLRVDGEEHFLGKADLAIPSSPRGEADFIASTQVPLAAEWRGKVGELILRVSISPTEQPLAPGSTALTRVWIDNVRLGPAGAPMQTESPTQVAKVVPTLTVGELTSLIDASRTGWRNLVDVPDGIGGITSRDVGVATLDFSLPDGADRQARNTGFGQGGLDKQRFFANLDIASVQSILNDQEARNIGVSLLGAVAFTDQLRLNSETSLATNSHAVQAQNESDLFWEGEGASLSQVIVNHDGALHPSIGEDGATINQSVIEGATHFDIRRDLASQSGNGAITDPDILNLEKFPLESLELNSSLGREGVGLIEANLFFNRTAGLAQSEHQQNQSALQHSPSFGTPTLPPDRDLGNHSTGNGQWAVACPLKLRRRRVCLVCSVCLVRGCHPIQTTYHLPLPTHHCPLSNYRC